VSSAIVCLPRTSKRLCSASQTSLVSLFLTTF
jgi:hypothetical protein